MTRDEAIEKLANATRSKAFNDGLIDAFVVLGILELDEPRKESVFGRFCKAIYDHPELKRTAPAYVLEAIESAGLELTEK